MVTLVIIQNNINKKYKFSNSDLKNKKIYMFNIKDLVKKMYVHIGIDVDES